MFFPSNAKATGIASTVVEGPDTSAKRQSKGLDEGFFAKAVKPLALLGRAGLIEEGLLDLRADFLEGSSG